MRQAYDYWQDQPGYFAGLAQYAGASAACVNVPHRKTSCRSNLRSAPKRAFCRHCSHIRSCNRSVASDAPRRIEAAASQHLRSCEPFQFGTDTTPFVGGTRPEGSQSSHRLSSFQRRGGCSAVPHAATNSNTPNCENSTLILLSRTCRTRKKKKIFEKKKSAKRPNIL